MAPTPSRFCVGIDLGTTNSVICYVDSQSDNPLPQVLAIPQLIAPGEIANLPSLPSFIYLPEDGVMLYISTESHFELKNEDFSMFRLHVSAAALKLLPLLFSS